MALALRAAGRHRSTISEFVNGHGMRQCRYRNEDKAHIQHVLTASAVNLERIDVHLPPTPARRPRNPTALQGFLDWQHIPGPGPGASPPIPQADMIVLKTATAVLPRPVRKSATEPTLPQRRRGGRPFNLMNLPNGARPRSTTASGTQGTWRLIGVYWLRPAQP